MNSFFMVRFRHFHTSQQQHLKIVTLVKFFTFNLLFSGVHKQGELSFQEIWNFRQMCRKKTNLTTKKYGMCTENVL
ncbi:hypothetical protein P5673_001363 [Acropora cervicornis]|uniref:Uncharacterized protein n=1 Tax=Acropora cervicornis TaxID=6130 RepID=A0AAD9VH28_ACRCE|nr:hypothetical protein P5673_001363 [Acropora cervicornis]